MFSDDSLVHLAGIFHNLYLRLEETEHDLYDGDSGWYVYIHHAAERPTLGVRTHGTSLYPGQGRDLRLDMKKVVFIMNSFCFYIIALQLTLQCQDLQIVVSIGKFSIIFSNKTSIELVIN